jgi:hypothetical protein
MTVYLSPKRHLFLQDRSWLWPRPHRLKLDVKCSVAGQENRAARFSLLFTRNKHGSSPQCLFCFIFSTGIENKLEKWREKIKFTFVWKYRYYFNCVCYVYYFCSCLESWKSGNNGKSIPAAIAVTAAIRTWNCNCRKAVTLSVCLSRKIRQ